MADGPPAGDHFAILISEFGLIPNNGVAINVPLVITSVSPNVNVNYIADTLQITGTGFESAGLAGTTVALNDGTNCLVKSSTSTQITCQTDTFTTIDAAATFAV